MISKIPPAFLALLAVGVLGGCVTSKTPVGGKVADLRPEVWNAKWRGGDGSTIKTRIKDARLGIVEVTPIKLWTKPRQDDSKPVDMLVRVLGPYTIINEPAEGGYQFARVAVDANHLVCFDPSESVFADLIKRGEIPGKLDKDKNSKTSNSCTIDHFTERDFQRLKKQGFDTGTLFNADPTGTVLIRDHGIW